MTYRTWRISAVLLAALLCAAQPSSAQQAEPPRLYSFNIPSGSLLTAVRHFSEQTRIQVTANFGPPEMQDLPVPELIGDFDARDALDRILSGSALHARWDDDGTVHIFPRDLPHAADGINEIVVTGTRLGRGGEGPAPVRIYRREDINRYGASTIPGVAGYFTQQPFSFGERAQRSGAQHFQMRGLGVDATLVLINGRRAPPSATSVSLNAFDLNTIPLTAVERIDVMSDSVSAIYGADAIGGVVNVILKKDVESPDLFLHYGAAAGGGEERRIAGSIGGSVGRFKGSLSVDYFERSMLVGAERELWRSQNYSRFGGTDYRVPTANPGNVYSMTGEPLPGLPTSQASIPAGATGMLRPEDFLATAGELALASSLETWSIVPDLDRLSAFASGELSLNHNAVIFGEALIARSNVYSQNDQPFLAGEIVPAENPFNPFGQPVAVDYSMEGMEPIAFSTESKFERLVLGARGGLSSWDWELAFVSSDERADVATVNELDPLRVSTALASRDPMTALNPFSDGPAGGRSLLSSLVAAPEMQDFYSGGLQISGFVRGELIRMPGGTGEFVVGGEWRQEEIRFFEEMPWNRKRDVSSGFAEIMLPVLEELSIKLAWRQDDYHRANDSGNPQYGLIWRPAQDWLVRAAYGTSFRPPSLTELYSPRSEVVFPLADPRRGGSVSRVRFIIGGNPDLKNISAHSFTGGFVYRPDTSPGPHLGIHYWRVVMDNRIITPRVSDLLSNEDTVPGRVTRHAPTDADMVQGWSGALAAVDTSLLNYGRLETSGVDLDLSYRMKLTAGQLQAALSATWIDDYFSQDLSSIDPVERVGIANIQGTIPRWRLVGSLAWEGWSWGVSTTATFTPRYRDSGFAGVLQKTLPSRTIVDIQAWSDLGRLFEPGLFNELKVTAGVANIFNRDVDFAQAGLLLGYDASQADLKQRFTYLRIVKGF